VLNCTPIESNSPSAGTDGELKRVLAEFQDRLDDRQRSLQEVARLYIDCHVTVLLSVLYLVIQHKQNDRF